MEQAAEEECDEPEQQPGLGYYFFVLWIVGIGIVAAVCRPDESLTAMRLLGLPQLLPGRLWRKTAQRTERCNPYLELFPGERLFANAHVQVRSLLSSASRLSLPRAAQSPVLPRPMLPCSRTDQ